MTQPITDEELTELRRLADARDWCARCGEDDDCYCHGGGGSGPSIRSILARIDAAEGR